MNPPNKHHYIPAFYLSRWAGNDGCLCQWSRPYGQKVKPLRVHPNATGYARKLYELRGYEPQIAQQVEQNFFQPVDALAAAVLSEAEATAGKVNWTAEKRSSWTRFIISLLLRCPEDVAAFRTNWERDFFKVDTISQEKYEKFRTADDPPLFSDYLRSRPEPQRERLLFNVFLSLFNYEDTGQYINDMNWGFLIFSRSELEFLTSDRPIIRTSGIKPPDGHIVFPVGPNSVFVAGATENIYRRIAEIKPRELIREINRQVVGSAVKFAYSRDDSSVRFMQNRFGTTPQPRIAEALKFSD